MKRIYEEYDEDMVRYLNCEMGEEEYTNYERDNIDRQPSEDDNAEVARRQRIKNEKDRAEVEEWEKHGGNARDFYGEQSFEKNKQYKMKNLMVFEEFCKACMTAPDDKQYAELMKGKAKRSRYKDPEHEKKRKAFMKNLMKDKMKK